MAQVSLDYTLTEGERVKSALGPGCKCILLSVPGEGKLFLIFSSDRDGKECIC